MLKRLLIRILSAIDYARRQMAADRERREQEQAETKALRYFRMALFERGK